MGESSHWKVAERTGTFCSPQTCFRGIQVRWVFGLLYFVLPLVSEKDTDIKCESTQKLEYSHSSKRQLIYLFSPLLRLFKKSCICVFFQTHLFLSFPYRICGLLVIFLAMFWIGPNFFEFILNWGVQNGTP